MYWVPVAMFSAYPVLSLYGGNAEMLDLPILIRPLAFSMALAVVVYPFFLAIYRRQLFASCAAVVFMILFWNYTAIFDGFNRVLNARHWHMLPVVILIFAHVLF